MMGKRGKLHQYMAGCAANLAAMSIGCMSGWTSPTLPKLEQPGAHLHSTPGQSSWIVSLSSLGCAMGPFIGAYLANRIGRKWTLLSLGFPCILSWILITSAQNLEMIYAARFIGGVGAGTLFVALPMYAGEIAEDNLRGALGSLLNAFIVSGLVYEYSIGPYVSYVWLGVASTIIPMVFVVVFFFMPDSPIYLLSKGKKEEASKALQWLRDSSKDGVEKELQVMQDSVDEASKNSGSFKDLFATRGTIKALYLSCGLAAFQQFCGVVTLLLYTETIFELAGGSLSSDISSIIVGLVMMISSFCTPLLVERLGRRPLLFISATGMCIAEAALGTFFYLKEVEGTDLSAVGWLPLLCFVSCIIVYSIGYGPLPWAIAGELFPSNIKGIGISVLACFNFSLGFFISKFFQSIVDSLGTYTAFWIFAAGCSISNIFVFFLLPETKGKSLQEIQDILNKRQ